MRGGKLLLTVAVTAVLLLQLALRHGQLSVWRPGVNKIMQPPWSWLDSTENPPLEACTSHTDDHARIASHIISFGIGTERHVKQPLEEEFERWHSVLLQGCNKYEPRIANPLLNWRTAIKYVLPELFSLFKSPKSMQAESPAIREFIGRVENKTASASRPLSAVAVRQPLAKLASAYRDKIMDGKALFEYDDDWLPALISHHLHRNREFNQSLSRIKKAYQVYMDNYVSPSGALLAKPSQEEIKFYGVEEMENAYLMINKVDVFKKFVNAYNLINPVQQFWNTSFTFNQFLRHVGWTHDMAMPDEHTEMCYHCRMRSDYILKLETIQKEIQHWFCGMLGFPDEVSFPVKHQSYAHRLSRSDWEYYANVSSEMMHQLFDVYKHDFAIFENSRDL
ncbi:uncharacterized protein LOC127008873 [Eriocheir sinensis]|uniref:uncharacterized protein LOC127008873 n=1 Tax=Eriocheir sinensis TaxID=95602 RepID=UPI0021C63EB1|nr:uncharacterized protein LOC127008873 [Eriocheir sinensis]